MPNPVAVRAATLYATVGLPASGKTTLAKKMLADAEPGTMMRVNKDELRSMLHNDAYVRKVTPKQVSAARASLVASSLMSGVDVVVDDTNLVPAHLDELRHLAFECGARFEAIDLTNVSSDECVRRDALRAEKSVGESVIRGMEKLLLKRRTLVGHDPIVAAPEFDPELETIVLCDVDGTLAHMAGRSPYDMTRVGEDTVSEPVAATVRALLSSGTRVVIFSGRDDSSRDLTAAWLADHVGAGLEMFMRKRGDNRRDSLVKYDMYNTHIRGKYNVQFVLDDRDQVVRMWRTLGLPCFQVAPGAF